MTKPITPDEIDKEKVVPDAVLEAANELIKEKWDGREARFELDELKARARRLLGKNKYYNFQDGELDIEPIFRAVGWSVTFDRPGFNESYEAYFIFKKGRKRS